MDNLREHLTFLQPIKGSKMGSGGIDKDLLLCYSFCHHIEKSVLNLPKGLINWLVTNIDVGGWDYVVSAKNEEDR